MPSIHRSACISKESTVSLEIDLSLAISDFTQFIIKN